MENAEVVSIDKKNNKVKIKDSITGKESTLTLVDPEEIERMRNNIIQNMAERLHEDDLIVLMDKTQRFLSYPVTITEYEVVVGDLVDSLKLAYSRINSNNIFHGIIKSLDPEIYGKAQTCIPTIVSLASILNKIAEEKEIENRIEIPEEEPNGL